MAASPCDELDEWFVHAVLPLEPALTRFLRLNWRHGDEVADLRQDVYVRVYEAASRARPLHVKAFVFAAARNLLIDRARRAQVIGIDAVADIDALPHGIDDLTPERHCEARSDLRALQRALETLPPACRDVVALRKISGFSQREVAQHLGIAESTVEKQIGKGLRLLARALDGAPLRSDRPEPARAPSPRLQST